MILAIFYDNILLALTEFYSILRARDVFEKMYVAVLFFMLSSISSRNDIRNATEKRRSRKYVLRN